MTTPTIEDDIAALSAAIDAETTLVYIGQEMRDSIARLIAALQGAREELSQPARVGLTSEQLFKMAADAESPEWGEWFNDEDALLRFARAIERVHNIPAAPTQERAR